MNLQIREHAWEDIESFWKYNEHLKTEIVATQMTICSSFIELLEMEAYRKDKVLVAYGDAEIVGCVRIQAKHYKHLRIAALGKMAVIQKYRRNGIANHLMRAACFYMNSGIFDVSILWASVLALYEKHGYVAIHKNMMVKFLKTTNISVQELRQIPNSLGTW